MSSEESTNANDHVFNAEPEGELGPNDDSVVPLLQTYMRVTPELRSLIEAQYLNCRKATENSASLRLKKNHCVFSY